MKKVNLTKFFKDAKHLDTKYTLDDFYKNQIVECSLFQGFMRVVGFDTDLNQVFIHNVNELTDIYMLKPYQLSIPKVDEKIVELLYL